MLKTPLPTKLCSIIAAVTLLVTVGASYTLAQTPDEEIDYHYCTPPTSETAFGITMNECSDAHAALARRIHGDYWNALQASLPPGHTIVDVQISGTGFQQTPSGSYYVTLTWFYCVRIGPAPPYPVPPLPLPAPVPNP